MVWWRDIGEELLSVMLRPVNRRRAKLQLILEGGGSDHMEEGGDSRRPHQTRPHTPGGNGLGDGRVVERNTTGAREVGAGLYLTFPTCGLHLGECVHCITSLTVNQASQYSAIDLFTAPRRDNSLRNHFIHFILKYWFVWFGLVEMKKSGKSVKN